MSRYFLMDENAVFPPTPVRGRGALRALAASNGVNIYNDKLGSASDIYYLFVLNRPFELIKSASLLERLRPVGPDILEPQTDQLFAQVADCCFYFWQFRHNDFI